jgi:hypothetical protein
MKTARLGMAPLLWLQLKQNGGNQWTQGQAMRSMPLPREGKIYD